MTPFDPMTRSVLAERSAARWMPPSTVPTSLSETFGASLDATVAFDGTVSVSILDLPLSPGLVESVRADNSMTLAESPCCAPIEGAPRATIPISAYAAFFITAPAAEGDYTCFLRG